MNTRYNVTFSLDGSIDVIADSAEEAEADAIEFLEGTTIWGADTCDIDGCTVRVAMRFTYDDDGEPDKCEKVERVSKVVEFS